MSERDSIILADDHEVVRAGLRDALAHLEPELDIIEAGNLAEAIEKSRNVRVRLVLLDFYMPGTDGSDGIETMIGALPGVPVAVISGSIRRRDVDEAMAAGAAGFIPKTMKLEAMANAVRLILSGERYLPYELVSGDDANSASALLTPREMEVVEAIAQGKSNKQIARDLEIEEVTVKLHASHAYRKLGVSNRTEAAIRAQELGLV